MPTIREQLQLVKVDDLLAIIDAVEGRRYSALTRYAPADENISSELLHSQAVAVLKELHAFDDKGIREAWRDWQNRTLTDEYENSYCSQCPNSPGLDHYLQHGGKLSFCYNPHGDGAAVVLALPARLEDCVWEKKRVEREVREHT